MECQRGKELSATERDLFLLGTFERGVSRAGLEHGPPACRMGWGVGSHGWVRSSGLAK